MVLVTHPSDGKALYNVLRSWREKMMLWKYWCFFTSNYHLG